MRGTYVDQEAVEEALRTRPTPRQTRPPPRQTRPDHPQRRFAIDDWPFNRTMIFQFAILHSLMWGTEWRNEIGIRSRMRNERRAFDKVDC